MDEVRRESDGELCGYVTQQGDQWQAVTVFGAELSTHGRRDDAIGTVLSYGLAALAERWTLERPNGSRQVACIQEAHPGVAILALDYYPMPGVPTMTITADMLASGDWTLTRDQPH